MHGEYKVPGGKLVVVDCNVNNGKLSQVQLSGDFFLEPDEALQRITAAVEGADTELSAADLAKRIDTKLEPTDILFGITSTAVGIAIRRALGRAIDWEEIDFDVIHGPSVEPEINQALDETLVNEVAAGRRRPFLRIWEWNGPQVVIGSFQSYANEVNPEGVARHGVLVTRRITGGGAMFMEPGNCVTYSLVVPTALVDGLTFVEAYAFLDQWCMEALEKCGVKAHYVPLNDIASTQGKIGGAAQKRFANGYILHHVTMAYDIDAQKMMECLRIGKEKIKDKGMRSAVKRVDPMRTQTGMERAEIIRIFKEHFTEKYGAHPSELTETELAQARQLARTKFRNDEWTFRLP